MVMTIILYKKIVTHPKEYMKETSYKLNPLAERYFRDNNFYQ